MINKNDAMEYHGDEDEMLQEERELREQKWDEAGDEE